MADESDLAGLLQLAASGDFRAFGRVFQYYRTRLRHCVRLRMDPRLGSRLDPSDVIQEAYLDATRRLNEYVLAPDVSLFIWLRSLTTQRLIDLHRHHLGAKMRDAGREISLGGGGSLPPASAQSLAALLVEPQTPYAEAVRGETQQQVRAALEELDPIDREVLAMRHFELLSNQEIAQVLGISVTAASNRYVRAVKRIKSILDPKDEQRP